MKRTNRKTIKGSVVVSISVLGAFIMSIALKNILMLLTSPSAYSPMQNSSDFAMSDIYEYISDDSDSQYKSNEIVVVSTDGCNRQEIAKLIEKINDNNPKVIGLDVIFRQSQSSDSILISAINKSKKIVLPYDMGYDENLELFLKQDSSYFYKQLKNKNFGAINLSGNSIRNVIRRFKPIFITEDDSIDNFSSAIAKIYSSDKYNDLIGRNNDNELIIYHNRDIEIYSGDELISLKDKDLRIKDKIVLLGEVCSNSDMHTTPIKEQEAGVVIHAHTIDTILNGYYVKETNNLVNYGIAIVVTLLFCGFTYYVRENVKLVGRLLIRFIQFGLILMYLIVGYYLYSVNNLYIDFSVSALMTSVSILMLDLTGGLYGLYILTIKKIKEWKK